MRQLFVARLAGGHSDRPAGGLALTVPRATRFGHSRALRQVAREASGQYAAARVAAALSARVAFALCGRALRNRRHHLSIQYIQ